jgi:signal transduction histidine kinase
MGLVIHMTNLTREELEQQIGTLNQVSQDLVRDLSLDTVLERIVELARDQVQAEYAALAIRNENGVVVSFIQVGMTQDEISRMPHFPRGEGLLGMLQNKNEVINIPDISEDPRAAGFPEGHPRMSSMLGVPIVSGERILGQIYLTNKQGQAEFTKDDARLMKTLAAYAAVAITNTQLYNHILKRDKTLNQQNQDLSLINELAQTVASSWDIKEIMSQTLKNVVRNLEVNTGEVFLRDRGGKDLRLSMLRGEGFDAFNQKTVFRVGEGLVGKVAELNKPLVVQSLDSDSRIQRRGIPEAGFRTMVGIPLQARRKVIGVLTLASKQPRVYPERELDLLLTIGTWAGTAIENARLQQQSQRVAILEERERIGMDLHDGIIQSLYSIGLTLDYVKTILDEDREETLEKLNLAVNGLNHAISDIRSYVSDLRPRQMQENKTFPENLELLVQEFEANSRITGHFEDRTESSLQLPYQNAVTLFHICQEALSNVARHADATRAEVQLWVEDARAYLKVTDDGKGFNLDTTETSLGHGLSNMQRRTRKVGGNLTIHSAPLQGTTVEAWVPTEE